MKWWQNYILIFLLSGCSPQTDTPEIHSNDQVKSNKEIVHTFYKQVIGQHDEALADQLLADDYIQHNPMVKTGKAGFFEVLAFLKQMPKPENPQSPIVRTIGEGDYVALHLSVEVAGTKKTVIDLFRLKEGKLVEHWDAMEDHPEQTLNGRSMTDGVYEIDEKGNAGQYKKTVSNYYQEVWIDKRLEELATFVASDLIQHSPDVANGAEGLREYIQGSKVSVMKVHRMIGEGDFVVAQLEGQVDDSPYVFYDILRLSNDKIVEQWRVKQAIPETMLHENGML